MLQSLCTGQQKLLAVQLINSPKKKRAIVKWNEQLNVRKTIGFCWSLSPYDTNNLLILFTLVRTSLYSVNHVDKLEVFFFDACRILILVD